MISGNYWEKVWHRKTQKADIIEKRLKFCIGCENKGHGDDDNDGKVIDEQFSTI